MPPLPAARSASMASSSSPTAAKRSRLGARASARRRPNSAPTPAVSCARGPASISLPRCNVRLVVTRPQPGADRTAAALRARGHAVLVAPLLRIEAIIDAEIAAGPFAAILATSANAAAAIARHKRFAELRALPVFAVGDHSAQAMRAVGFADGSAAHGDLHGLADLVAAELIRSAALL